MRRITDEEFCSEQREYILANKTLSDEDRLYLLAWVKDGCPADEPTDVGFEEGDFC